MEQTTPQILWRTKYAAAYMEDNRMIIRYRFPYSRQREADLLGAYQLSPKDRLPYYQTLSAMVEHNLAITKYLESEGVPSILTFEHAYQKQEDNGLICVYTIPNEPVTPITRAIFSSDCSALTALDVFLRLAHILRDINKTPMSPVLRYLDMDDVYLTGQNKILLGGFFYATAEGFQQPPDYLPDAAPPALEFINHTATAGTDMQILARIAWNIFSGLPWDTCHTYDSLQIPPRYAPAPLLQVLELGLKGDPNDINTFRKRLMQCRKDLSKTDFAQLTLSMAPALRKVYSFRTAPDATP